MPVFVELVISFLLTVMLLLPSTQAPAGCQYLHTKYQDATSSQKRHLVRPMPLNVLPLISKFLFRFSVSASLAKASSPWDPMSKNWLSVTVILLVALMTLTFDVRLVRLNSAVWSDEVFKSKG